MKKIIALTMAMLMVLGLFAGCAGNQPAAEDNKGAATPTDPTEGEATFTT